MKLEYENRTLRVENAHGLRWQLTEVDKPRLPFEFDGLQVNEVKALRRVGTAIYSLTEMEAEQVRDFVQGLQPPPWATFQAQTIIDLRAFVHGLIGKVMADLEYEGLLDVMITAREGSTDLFAEEARRVLAYVDLLWNTFHGLEVRIKNTPESQMLALREYANMIPAPPPLEHFTGAVPQDLFDGTPGDH